MQTLLVTSPKHGKFKVLFDDKDVAIVSKYKWGIQKALSGLYYPLTKVDGKRVLMHQLLIPLQEGMERDHINGNGLDNRRENLRLIPHSANMYNKKMYKNNRSGYKGVWPEYKKWVAQVRCKGKLYRKRGFRTAREAALWYNEKALKYHGEFARLNDVG